MTLRPYQKPSRTCVLAVPLQILQEVVDDWHWDDVANVLTRRQALEGNAHHVVTQQHRTTAVAAVDLQRWISHSTEG